MQHARSKHFSLIDLFAGCGGLSLGLEQAGFRPLLFSEINASAAATYRANRSELDLIENRDIYSLSNHELLAHLATWKGRGIREIDLIAGGPPCQGYSGIGHRRTFTVTREEIPSNHLYKEMIRVIRIVKPRLFLFENVKGLLSGRWTPDGESGEIWRDVKRGFEGVEGYHVRWSLIHAKDYGIPQNRPRVIMVGVRNDLGWRPALEIDVVADGLLPRPTGGAPNPVEALGDLVDEEYLGKLATEAYPAPARGTFQREMRTSSDGAVLGKGRELTEQEYSQHSDRIRTKFEHMLRNGGQIPTKYRTKKFAQRVLPREWGVAGPTITATSLPDDYVHFAQPRSLTVREWARLQTFPDRYVFRGPRTTGGHRRAGNPSEGLWDREVPKYTQIGNAVPVRLAKAVGLHLADFLRGMA